MGRNVRAQNKCLFWILSRIDPKQHLIFWAQKIRVSQNNFKTKLFQKKIQEKGQSHLPQSIKKNYRRNPIWVKIGKIQDKKFC